MGSCRQTLPPTIWLEENCELVHQSHRTKISKEYHTDLAVVAIKSVSSQLVLNLAFPQSLVLIGHLLKLHNAHGGTWLLYYWYETDYSVPSAFIPLSPVGYRLYLYLIDGGCNYQGIISWETGSGRTEPNSVRQLLAWPYLCVCQQLLLHIFGWDAIVVAWTFHRSWRILVSIHPF